MRQFYAVARSKRKAVFWLQCAFKVYVQFCLWHTFYEGFYERFYERLHEYLLLNYRDPR